jgi:hypothetical protein
MSPPTEQLIRDYLNRLSMAARGQLNAEDRLALVARTRDFVERNANAAGPATAKQVAALLARLGDPDELVAQEAERLAAMRGEPAGRPGARRIGLLRRFPGQASWHWPRSPGAPDLQFRLLTGEGAPAGASPGQASDRQPGAGQRAPDPRGLAADSTQREPPIWVPRQPSAPESGPGPVQSWSADPDGRAGWPPVVANGNGSIGSPGTEPGSPDLTRAPEAAAGPDPGAPAGRTRAESGRQARAAAEIGSRVASSGASLLVVLAGRARQNPIEALAVVLLGLGGAAYPPVWLLGAIVALASRVWDGLDKWIGLAGPVILLIIGTGAGIALGGSYTSAGSYMHETWIYLDVLSRVAAVLGTGYLVWRLVHGRRRPPQPPWNRPHKVG